MNSIKKNFGQRVKEIRKSKGLTQEQLAEKTGMDTPNICRIEAGTHFPLIKNLEKIASALDTPVKEFFNYEHKNNEKYLIDMINSYLTGFKKKDIELVYKFVEALNEYKN